MVHTLGRQGSLILGALGPVAATEQDIMWLGECHEAIHTGQQGLSLYVASRAGGCSPVREMVWGVTSSCVWCAHWASRAA